MGKFTGDADWMARTMAALASFGIPADQILPSAKLAGWITERMEGLLCQAVEVDGLEDGTAFSAFYAVAMLLVTLMSKHADAHPEDRKHFSDLVRSIVAAFYERGFTNLIPTTMLSAAPASRGPLRGTLRRRSHH